MGAAERAYAEQLEKDRKEKDYAFKHGSESPIPEKDRAAFSGLSYFAPAPQLKFTLAYQKLNPPEPYLMQTTGKTPQEYTIYATVTFDLEGKQHTLYLYQRPSGSSDRSFFLPFTDLTNGHQTYGGGRYLDVEVVGSGQVTLDFNQAYSPYCAFDHEFSCPIPPKENHLPVAILAGEKVEK